MQEEILVVDDELDIRELICDILNDEGYKTHKACSSDQVLDVLKTLSPAMVILDIWLQGSELDGVAILDFIKKKFPYIQVIMISGHGNIDVAIQSIKLGAFDYIQKPFAEDQLVLMVKRALEFSKLSKENARLKRVLKVEDDLVGEDISLNKLKNLIKKIALSSSRVLICGPVGVGKKLVAQIIHNNSSRKEQPFLTFDATGCSEEAADRELFGVIDSDQQNKVGLLEFANSGTLFIEEITELPLTAQGKLLRFLQSGTINRAGTNIPVTLDVRVICSSSKSIQTLIDQGKFRQELFLRVSVASLELESLSRRKADIPILCHHFINLLSERYKYKIKLKDDTIAIMQSYHWPGNVRQVKNVIEWLFIIAEGLEDKSITSDMLPAEFTNKGPISGEMQMGEFMNLTLKESRELFETQYLMMQFSRFSQNVAKTAEFIDMERSALHRKLKMLGII